MKYPALPNHGPVQYYGGPLDGQEVGKGRPIYRLADGAPCSASHGDRRTCYNRWQRGETGLYARDYTKALGEHYRWITAGPAYRDIPQAERAS